jgi:GT2 family glycosyltransferase
MVFTDDDVHVAPDWFETLVRAAMRDGPGVVVTGRVLPSGKGEGKGFVPSVMVDTNPALYRGRIGEDIIYPHNLAVHRSAWQAAGPFDPRLGPGSRFPAAEDNDWCYRLLEAGYQIRYLPEAVVHHRAWRTRRHYLPLRWAYGKGQGAYYAKHMSWRDGYMARRLVRESEARMVRTLRRWRQPLGALGEVVYLAGLWSGTLLWLLAERRRA